MNKLAYLFLSVWSLLSFAGAAQDSLLVKPYVMDVTQTEATIAFHLSSPQPASVRVKLAGEIKSFASEKASSPFVRVTGLKPGKAYPFSVHAGSGPVAQEEHPSDGFIRTACRPGESFSFAVYGDPRPGENASNDHHLDVLEQMVMKRPDLALVLGDIVDDGSNADLWMDFLNMENPLISNAAIYPVMGDNDYMLGKGLYDRYFPGKREPYHFEWGGVQFFGASAWDTMGKQPKSEFDASSTQVAWLEQQLQKESVQAAPFRIVFLHDCVFVGRGKSADVLRKIWHPLFVKYRVNLVFSSWHLYERHLRDGVHYVVTGGGRR